MSSSPASDLLGADFVRELEPPKIATAQRLAAAIGYMTLARSERAQLFVAGGSLAVVPDIPHAGFYTVAWQGPQAGSRVVPANLTRVAESDLHAKRKAA